MHKQSAKEFLKRTQPDAWESVHKCAARIAHGLVAEQTTGCSRTFITDDISACERVQAKQFVATACAVLAGLLLELSDSGEDIRAAAASPYCALFLASCPIEALADVGLAAFKKPGGVAKLETLLDQFPNFRALAVADVFDRTDRIIGRAPKLH
jgi:hypothetical protein